MRLLLLSGAVLVFGTLGCKKDPKECAALLDKTEAHITDELRWTDAHTMVTRHFDNGTEKLEPPHVAMAAYPFEPGLVIHIDDDQGALPRERLEKVIASEACRHKSTPLRLYLLASPATPAPLLADRVAWLEAAAAAWKKPIEILMPVKLPAEIRYYDWPDGTPSEVKALGKQILDAPEGDARLKPLQEKIRMASAGCDAIKKRIEEASDAAYWLHAYHYAATKGLRDCGCNGVDAHTVIGLYHIFEITSSDTAWVRLSAATGTPLAPGETVGAIFAGAKADAKSTLRVPDAKLPAIEPLACDALPASVELSFHEQWDKPPAKPAELLEELNAQLAGCLERSPLERSAIADLIVELGGSLHEPGEGETSLTVNDESAKGYDLEQCMRSAPHLDNQEVGFARIEMYIPGKQ